MKTFYVFFSQKFINLAFEFSSVVYFEVVCVCVCVVLYMVSNKGWS